MTQVRSTAARDLRYGRRGGRWADPDRTDATETARIFANLREKNHRLDRDDPLPGRDRTDGQPGTVPVRRWPDPTDWQANNRPETVDEWQGRARMAAARRAAGLDLDEVDLEALEMWPDPPSGLLGPARQGSAA